MSAKYQPLEDYLKSMPGSRTHITLSFADIEKLTGHELPSSAYQHRAWWSNQADLSNRPQAKAWRNAGFKVESVKCGSKDGLVSFSREGKIPISASSIPKAHAHGLTRSVLPIAEKPMESDRAPGNKIVLVSCVNVRRQIIWDRWGCKLMEGWPHLVG